jgi:Fe-S cluster biogenesis protein NfuA
MSIQNDVEKALDGLRQGFKADGADLRVEAMNESSVSVRLVGTEETCWDCIVSTDQLRHVVTSVLAAHVPTITSVDLIDPRSEV